MTKIPTKENNSTPNTQIESAEFAGIDFECLDSLNQKNEIPVQIGIVIMKNLKIKPSETLRTYIKPNKTIKQNPNQTANIDLNKLQSAPSLPEIWHEIKNLLEGRIIIAHASATEKRFLRFFPLHNFKHWLDTLKITRTAYPHIKKHTLGYLAENSLKPEDKKLLAEICPDLNWHDALYDACASTLILRRITLDFNLQTKPIKVLQNINNKAYYHYHKKN